MNSMETGYFEPILNKIYRIAIHYDGAYRPIFWFKMASDGSVYMGPRIENASIVKAGGGVVRDDGSINLKYKDGEIIDVPGVLKTAGKISFHASGAINSLKRRTYRQSLRDLKAIEMLGFAIFHHPSKFKEISKIRQTDICLNYPIGEDYPLSMQIHIAPSRETIPQPHESYVHQIMLVLPYAGFNDDIQDLTLTIHLGHGAKGSWPPYTYFLFPHLPNE